MKFRAKMPLLKGMSKPQKISKKPKAPTLGTYKKIKNIIKLEALINQLSEVDLEYIIAYSLMLRRYNEQIKILTITRNKK